MIAKQRRRTFRRWTPWSLCGAMLVITPTVAPAVAWAVAWAVTPTVASADGLVHDHAWIGGSDGDPMVRLARSVAPPWATWEVERHSKIRRTPRGAAATTPSSRVRRATRQGTCDSTLVVAAAFAPVNDERRPPPAESGTPDDLAERLIRESVTESGEDVMDRIIRLMSASARRLEVEFDAGPETQAVQRRIARELDDAIKLAASRMRRSSRSDPGALGDERRHRRGSRASREGEGETNENDAEGDSSQTATEASGVTTEGRDNDSPFRESRRGWGHLPRRQREEVLQGIGEQFLERYRDWIERYYRALQESEE